MYKPINVLIVPILFTFLSFGGCGAPAPKKFSNELVCVYAELLAMNEKEKITGTTPDSLYRLKVKEFFGTRKIDEGDFQNQINEISRDDAAWREFLSKATVALDSIKAARAVQH